MLAGKVVEALSARLCVEVLQVRCQVIVLLHAVLSRGKLLPVTDTIFVFQVSLLLAKSMVNNCVLGAFECGDRIEIAGRIVNSVGGATLQNNVALDCHKGQSASDGTDGKSLSSALFTAHYLEHTMGWDFDTVWQWNDKLNQPELKSVGSKAQPMTTRHGASASEQGDLLEQQLSANIWL